MNIQNAEKYSYRYSLDPGKGGNWHKNVVTAKEFLDVDNADCIKAYAMAHSASGYDARVDVEVTDGSLKGYSNIATASANKAEASESGHILGTFTAKATADSEFKERTSNYGTEYDLFMEAKADRGPPTVSGILGYYVDDIIKVAAGTYHENVVIDIRWRHSQPREHLTVENCDIHHNNAINGGGISNYAYYYTATATATIENSRIHNNTAGSGGGIYNYIGNLIVDQSKITKNTAGTNGGGIYNDEGTVTLTGSQVTKNKPNSIAP